MFRLKQEVNLFQQRSAALPFLCAKRLVQIWVCVFVVIAVVALEQKMYSRNQKNRIDQLKTTTDSMKLKLDVYRNDVHMKITPSPLELASADIKEKTKKLNGIIFQLQVMEQGPQYPLSTYLEGFALSHVQGTLFSHIIIKNTQRTMVIEGIALAPYLVPKMIASWQQSTALRDQKIKKVKLTQFQAHKPWVLFIVQEEK